MRTRNAFLAAASCAAAGLALAVPSAIAEDAPAVHKFKFTYEAKIPKPASGKHLEAWIPLPLEDDLQKVEDLKVSASVGGKDVAPEQTKEDQYGNRMVHVAVDEPAGDLAVKWTATVTRTEDRGQGKGPMNDRFKQPDKLVPLTGKASELAKSLGVESGDDIRVRAKKIYDNVLSTMVYDKKEPGFGRGDFDRACAVGKGNCTDFHAKFIGIGRAAGIPVRFTMGIPITAEKNGEPKGYHCWAHFHDGSTWIPVDISEAQKVNAKDPAKAQWFFGHIDPDRVALSVGRDVNLAPKQKEDALLFFVYPYAEVDGKKVDLAPDTRSFAWEAPQ